MAKKKKTEREHQLVFTRENYKLLIIGAVIIVIGFLLMAGGKAESPDQFNPEIFSFRRITLAPLLVLFGFAFEIYAIMKKPKANKEEQSS
jgi:membrane-bound ClpP family serine protease